MVREGKSGDSSLEAGALVLLLVNATNVTTATFSDDDDDDNDCPGSGGPRRLLH